jgi:N-acetylglucosaminyl-diphospho-decaprenol L-rhamnosyltransferase
MTELSISVVSYRTPTLLRACLQALERECAASQWQCEVFVIDNASGDGSADLVETEFPNVWLIRNEHNVGFGAAHNQALRLARGPYALVLNSDAVLQPGALGAMVEFMEQHPNVGACGPQLRYPDGRVQPSRRRFPTLATLFLESTQLQRLWPRNRVLDGYYMADRSDDVAQEVDWLVGACLCFRTAALEASGLFDERFFMYSEELDLARRLRATGWRLAYVPQAVVLHQEGASTSLDLAARDRQFQSSKLRYAAKWHGQPAALALRAYLILEYLLRGLEEGAKYSLGSRRDERRARLRVIGSGLRHTLLG